MTARASSERDLSGAPTRWRLADRSISRRKPGVATRRARDARENAAVRMDAAGATADAAAVDPRRVGAGNRAGRIASVARCGEARTTGARAGLTTRARTRADARGGAVARRVVARCPIFGVAIALAALATLAIARSPLHAPAAYARKETRLRVGAVHARCPAVTSAFELRTNSPTVVLDEPVNWDSSRACTCESCVERDARRPRRLGIPVRRPSAELSHRPTAEKIENDKNSDWAAIQSDRYLVAVRSWPMIDRDASVAANDERYAICD